MPEIAQDFTPLSYSFMEISDSAENLKEKLHMPSEDFHLELNKTKI